MPALMDENRANGKIKLKFRLIPMNILKIAAFADAGLDDNPAGIMISDSHPDDDAMRRIAGEDMGMRSRLKAEFTDEPGSSIRVSGSARIMEDSAV